MTDKNGAESGDVKDVNAKSETQESQNGGDNANVTAEQLQKQLEELQKATAGKDSKIAELQKASKELDEIKKQREQDEFDKKSAEEKTQLLQNRLDELERKDALSRELSSVGVSVDDAEKILKAGTASEQAKALKELLSNHAEKVSTNSVERLKEEMLSKTSKDVPNTDNNEAEDPLIAGMRTGSSF